MTIKNALACANRTFNWRYIQEMFNHGWSNYMMHAYPMDEVWVEEVYTTVK
jgi:hypothetical protein